MHFFPLAWALWCLARKRVTPNIHHSIPVPSPCLCRADVYKNNVSITGKKNESLRDVLAPPACFQSAMASRLVIKPLQQIHHPAHYRRSACEPPGSMRLAIDHTDTRSQPKGGWLISRQASPKTVPKRSIKHPSVSMVQASHRAIKEYTTYEPCWVDSFSWCLLFWCYITGWIIFPDSAVCLFS